MHITIDVNVKGLESLASLLGKVVGSVPETVSSVQNVVPMPTVAPVVQAPVFTGNAAPALSVVPNPAQGVAPTFQAVPADPAPAQASVPVAAQQYTLEQLAVAATQLMDAGRQPDLLNMLAAFGVQAVNQIPKEQYGAFATQLRALGARI